MLLDTPGALWSRALLDRCRAPAGPLPPARRLVVGVDPAAGSQAGSGETGIILAGIDERGDGMVLADLSGRLGPDGWARRVVGAWRQHDADLIVAEANQGGEMVAQVLRTVDPAAPVKLVRASRGKQARAEPVAALHEQGRVRHHGGFAELEDQMCAFTGAGDGGPSPDRMDALVWVLSELMLGAAPARSREVLF